MTRLFMTLVRGLALATCASGLFAIAAAQSGPIVSYDLYHDTSAPIREYASPQVPGALHPLERPRPLQRTVPGPISQGPDAGEQPFTLARVAAMLGFDFEGIPNSANGTLIAVPSDSNLSVGDTQVVEVINTAYEVYDKITGKSFFPPHTATRSRLFPTVVHFCAGSYRFVVIWFLGPYPTHSVFSHRVTPYHFDAAKFPQRDVSYE